MTDRLSNPRDDLENAKLNFGVADENLGRRVSLMRELLAGNGSSHLFDSLVSSVAGGSPLNEAREIASNGEPGVAALHAALLFGGLAKTAASVVLSEQAAAGNESAREALSRSFGQKAVYAGSFDPVTLGHLSVIRAAARIFDELVIAVGVNEDKDALFTLRERVELIRAEVKDMPCRINVVHFNGLFADFAKSIGATVSVRGVRGITDIDYEFQTADANRNQHPEYELDTIFIPSRSEHMYTSSTIVRRLASRGGRIEMYVTEGTEKAIRAKMKENKEREFQQEVEDWRGWD